MKYYPSVLYLTEYFYIFFDKDFFMNEKLNVKLFEKFKTKSIT